MKIAAAILTLLLVAPGLAQDFNFVDYDSDTDFAAIKTFAVREGEIKGLGAETNKHAINAVGETIRSGLAAKGLKESADKPDFVAKFSVTVSPSGTGNNAELKIELTRNGAHRIWRGHYETGPVAAPAIPKMLLEGADKLIKKYPPRKE